MPPTLHQPPAAMPTPVRCPLGPAHLTVAALADVVAAALPPDHRGGRVRVGGQARTAFVFRLRPSVVAAVREHEGDAMEAAA